MDVAGLFLKLPWLPFILILKFLSFEEKKQMRCLSTWFELKVTLVVLTTFNITIIPKQNSTIVSETLSKAMAKPFGPEIMLQLYFKRILNDRMKYIVINYTENIVLLDLIITGEDEYFLKPSLKFESLKSLSLKSHRLKYDETNNISLIIAAMITRHADKLEALKVDGGRIIDLKAPDLSSLKNLTLHDIDSEDAESLFIASRNSITSFELLRTEISIFSAYNEPDDESIRSFYLIPKLRSLAIIDTFSFDFMLYNSRNLVSLNISNVIMCEESYEWPELPNLKELIFQNEAMLPILYQCKDSLEYLEYHGYYGLFSKSFDDLNNVVIMPKLTDLFLGGPVFCKEFLSINCKSIEFLFLRDLEPWLMDDENLKINGMKTVLVMDDENLKINGMKTVLVKPCDYADQDIKGYEKLFPQAKVIVVKNENRLETKQQIGSRWKMKGFSFDTVNKIFRTNENI